MIGIELTQESDKPVWISLNSICQIKPYMGFDGTESGTAICLGRRDSIRVMESYTDVIKKCHSTANGDDVYKFNLAE